MADLFAFEPDGIRAAELDVRAREALAASIETIFDSVEELASDRSRLPTLLSSIRADRVRPALFGLYADLVEALYADDLARAETLSEELLSGECWRATAFRVVNFGDAELGIGQSERYLRYIDDENHALILDSLGTESRLEAEQLIDRTMRLLNQATPALASEVRALISEFVMVDSTLNAEGYVFAGGSSFYLWGALVLNMSRPGTRLDLALSIAHEAAHTHLFGMMLGEKLVENPDEELYRSPLRQDLRPMDGNVHAAYVLARMTYCLNQLMGSGLLDADEQDDAAKLLETYAENYADGLSVIEANARFTPEGARLFEGARAYMRNTQ